MGCSEGCQSGTVGASIDSCPGLKVTGLSGTRMGPDCSGLGASSGGFTGYAHHGNSPPRADNESASWVQSTRRRNRMRVKGLDLGFRKARLFDGDQSEVSAIDQPLMSQGACEALHQNKFVLPQIDRGAAQAPRTTNAWPQMYAG